MGCNQSKAADGAVVAQPPQPKSVVNPAKPDSATTKSVQPSPTEAVIQTNPTASPTNSTGPTSMEKKEDVPPCREVKIPSDFSMDDAPADEATVVKKEEETAKPVVKVSKKEAVVVAAMEPAAITMEVETAATPKAQTTYNDAVKELEDALLVSPRNAMDGKAPTTTTTTTVTNEEAVKELEDTLRRVRSEEEEAVATEKPKEEVAVFSKDEAVPLVDEEATENVAPAATTDTNAPKKNINGAHKCAKCDATEKAPGAFKTCAKCRDVYYCNKTCQKAHFKVHKKTCCKTESKKDLLVGSTNLNSIQVNNN